MEFYYYSGNHRFGPLNAEKLKELAKNGKITKDTIIESNGKRVQAGNIRGLFQYPNESAQYAESSPFVHNEHPVEPPVILTHTVFDYPKQESNLTSIKWSIVTDYYKTGISYLWRLGCLSVFIGILILLCLVHNSVPPELFFPMIACISSGIELFIFAWLVKVIYLTVDAHFAEQSRIASLLYDIKNKREKTKKRK